MMRGTTTVVKPRLLLLGLDPDIVDYSKSPVPELTAAKVRSAIEADRANLEALGYSVKVLLVDEGKTGRRFLPQGGRRPRKAHLRPRTSVIRICQALLPR